MCLVARLIKLLTIYWTKGDRCQEKACQSRLHGRFLLFNIEMATSSQHQKWRRALGRGQRFVTEKSIKLEFLATIFLKVSTPFHKNLLNLFSGWLFFSLEHFQPTNMNIDSKLIPSSTCCFFFQIWTGWCLWKRDNRLWKQGLNLTTYSYNASISFI